MKEVIMKQMLFGPEKFQTVAQGRTEGGQAWAGASEARTHEGTALDSNMPRGYDANTGRDAFTDEVQLPESASAMERGYKKLSSAADDDTDTAYCGIL